MADSEGADALDPVSDNLYEVDSSDPRSELIDRSGMDAEDVAQIGRVMKALSALREAEQELSDASQEYMKLSQQDMRALHYLIVGKNRGATVTPGLLSAHLDISPASTTKLLNRLERGGHIVRLVHPSDRRVFIIEITPETEASAMATVGKQQTKRFHAAARLSRQDREVVIAFLEDMTQMISLKDADWARAEKR